MSDPENVVPFKQPSQTSGSNDGSGSGFGERLARLEEKVEGVKENMATKADIQEVKTLIATKETQATRWQIGVMGGALIAVVAALIRTFLG